MTCSLSSHRRPLCFSSRRGSCGSGTVRRLWCTGRDIGLPRGANAARSPELLFGVSMSARRRRTPSWAARYGAPAPAARLVIHVHLLWSCTVCRTLWTTSSGQLSRMWPAIQQLPIAHPQVDVSRTRRSSEAAGQGHFCDEGRGQRGSTVIHSQLWITLWKDEENSVDTHVDSDVDAPSMHVSAGRCT